MSAQFSLVVELSGFVVLSFRLASSAASTKSKSAKTTWLQIQVLNI